MLCVTSGGLWFMSHFLAVSIRSVSLSFQADKVGVDSEEGGLLCRTLAIVIPDPSL